jgi:type IV secretory pathway VirB10-like protein
MTMLIIAAAVVAAVAVVAVAAVMTRRKKSTAVPPEEDRRVAQRPEKAITYKPIRKAPAAPAVPPARPPPVPPAAAAPARTAQAPGMGEEAKVREAIDNLEGVLKDAENAGLDTSKARQSLKIARNFYSMGKYEKAMLYCKMAEDNIG